MLDPRRLRAARRPEDLIAAVPLLVAILLGFSLAVFVLALITDGILYAALVLLGFVAAVAAVGLIGCTVAWRTGLLAPPGTQVQAPPSVGVAGDDEAPAEDAEAPRRRLHALRVEGGRLG